jgi:hypothetical protein
MDHHGPPPPPPEECLSLSRKGKYKGGTHIAQDVWTLQSTGRVFPTLMPIDQRSAKRARARGCRFMIGRSVILGG